jgi:hypothetical protein
MVWTGSNWLRIGIKQKPGFRRKLFWTLEILFKTGFTVCAFAITVCEIYTFEN